MEREPTAGVEAVDRALEVLRCFDERTRALSLTAISERTGFYKSTVLRLTASLERGGFLIRRADKSYALGAELMRLGNLYVRAFRLEEHVRPVLRRLLRATGESASFFRREGERRICLFREDSLHSVRDHIREGDMLPLDKGAAGHVLTRFDPARVGQDAVAARLAELPLLSVGERDAELAAVAVPVFSSGRRELTGTLVLSGPLSRFDAAAIAAMRTHLLEAGSALSGELGGEPYAAAPRAGKNAVHRPR